MREILTSMSVLSLKREISKTNIKGYSKMKKAEVINLMMKPEHRLRFSHLAKKGVKKERLPILKKKLKIVDEEKPAEKKPTVKKAKPTVKKPVEKKPTVKKPVEKKPTAPKPKAKKGKATQIEGVPDELLKRYDAAVVTYKRKIDERIEKVKTMKQSELVDSPIKSTRYSGEIFYNTKVNMYDLFEPLENIAEEAVTEGGKLKYDGPERDYEKTKIRYNSQDAGAQRAEWIKSGKDPKKFVYKPNTGVRLLAVTKEQQSKAALTGRGKYLNRGALKLKQKIRSVEKAGANKLDAAIEKRMKELGLRSLSVMNAKFKK